MNSVAIVSQDEKTRKYLESKVIADTKGMPKEEWLKHRQAGIGGSDASCIAGLNPWKSAIQLYMEKKEEDPQEIKSLRMELGNRLEGLVAELFTEETGLKVRNVNGILKNDKYPFALANIDRAIVGEKAFLECKTTNSYALKEWEEGVPAHYEIQCLHYMAITGATHCYIAALIGNSDFIWHKIERDEETIDYLMQIEKDFWENNILKDTVPMPDGSDAYSEYLKKKYDKSNGQVIELHLLENGPDKLSRYDEIVSDIKALESEKKLIEQEIQFHMEEFEIAKIGDRKVTWKSSSRNTIDSKKLKAEMPDIAQQYMKTSTSRTFRVGK
ncbi:MAG: YqaJ viral recombinase family protein [Romboutsia timonensis]|uniref:YqaJ viral recombinase family nuclease n=1 Tax=Romboutsia timonensis TaxID=1776391 RepID=UPI003991DA19